MGETSCASATGEPVSDCCTSGEAAASCGSQGGAGGGRASVAASESPASESPALRAAAKRGAAIRGSAGASPSQAGELVASCGSHQAGGVGGGDPFGWFSRMIPNCLAYAKQAKANGKRIVGIMCEFTPRELIMAAGGVPVCLCGGSAKTIAVAEQHLPANLCPLIKSTYGYHVAHSNPFIEMADLIVAETTCDGKKKMFELMGETRPMFVLELPQRSNDIESREHWYDELARFRADLESRFGVEITRCKLRSAIAVMNRERMLRRELAGLMKSDRPPMTGRQLLDLKSSISGIPADLEQYELALRMLRGMAPGAKLEGFGYTAGSEPSPQPSPGVPGEGEGAEGTKGRGEGEESNRSAEADPTGMLRRMVPDPKLGGRVRIMMTGVPIVHGAERVLDIIESSGGLVVCMENCTGLKPILEDVDEQAEDPLRAIADKYYHLPCSVMTRNTRRLEMLRQLAAEYRPQAVVELVWQACITYDVETHQIRRMVENELKLPYLRIETDYSPSDSARIATRVEAIIETVRQRI